MCTCHISISPVLSNFTSGGESSGWILKLSYFADVLLNSILWFLHGASHFQERFIFTDTGVILAVNFGIYSIDIYVPLIMQTEMMPLALRLKGSEINGKHGHKHYWEYIAEEHRVLNVQDQIPRINLVCFARWRMTNLKLSIHWTVISLVLTSYWSVGRTSEDCWLSVS